ncbi:MAG TPA: response regulator, partial [Flavobacteriales bacterium]|nr:response regulator [Flavobacteriales bacterium]
MKTDKDQPLIYLVDDDTVFLTLIQSELSSMGEVKTRTFASGESCLKQMHKNPCMVVLDYELSGEDPDVMNGVEVLKKIKETNPETEVVMISGWDDVTIAVASMKFGAYDYVVKNDSAMININNKAKNIFAKQEIIMKLAQEKVYRYYAVGFVLMIGAFILILHGRYYNDRC